MAEHRAPGWAPAPSGLFPSGPAQRPGEPMAVGPHRPTYREPHRISAAPVLAGMGAALMWFALFGAIGQSLLGYAWWTVGAAVSAWVVALILTVLGDRGVATGVAIVSGIGLSVAMGFVTHRWITTADWPLW